MTIKRRISLKVTEPAHFLGGEATGHPQRFRAIKKNETRLKLPTTCTAEQIFENASTPNAVGKNGGVIEQVPTSIVCDAEFPRMLVINENHVPFKADTHFLNNIDRSRSSDSSCGCSSRGSSLNSIGGSKIPESILMPDLDHDS